MNRREFCIGSCMGASALAFPVLTLAAQTKIGTPLRLRFAVSTPGGAWYAYGASIRTALLKGLPQGSTVDILNTPFAIANTRILAAHKAELGLSFPAVVKWAVDGIGPFKEKLTGLAGVAGGLDQYYDRITVNLDSKLASIAEIKEKKLPIAIGTGPMGSLNEYICRLILESHGITYGDIEKWGGKVTATTFSTLRTLFQDGRVSAIIGITTDGHPNTAQLSTSPGQRFIDLDDVSVKYLEKYGFTPVDMPKNTFDRQDKPVKCVGFTTSIYTTLDVPKESVYQITKSIMMDMEGLKGTFASMRNWTLAGSSAPQNLIVPLHPGAAQYFAEVAHS